ncbi:hypothetical protein HK101_008190 [Irineochytrium annulatum]|nr:hypothetical protein HK101_008190 [Irineochytrium annulatum]
MDGETSIKRKGSKWESEGSDDEGRAVKLKRKKKQRSDDKALAAASSNADTPDYGTPLAAVDEDALRPTKLPVPAVLSLNAFNGTPLAGCRNVDNYEKLNRIDEGSYGIVYRARERQTGEIVALKKLKLEKEVNGFPVTSLREIHTLLLSKHPNIVNVKEIVTTSSCKGIFIVMEFVEHDLKGLMEVMPSPFLQSEIKTLMIQLLSAINCLHGNWIVHRDLKTSNLLMNNRGEIKVADFGLARRFGDPPGPMTQLVVTLWYRAPELLLGAKTYTTAIDMWSIGCIFAELVNKEPLAPGKGEIDHAKSVNFTKKPFQSLRSRFPYLTENGIDLLSKLLSYDPEKRITAEAALKHPYFSESPAPKDPSLFPTFPSKSAGEKKKVLTPSAPARAHDADDETEDPRPSFDYSTYSSTGFRLRV